MDPMMEAKPAMKQIVERGLGVLELMK